jgi:hypothetical protein
VIDGGVESGITGGAQVAAEAMPYHTQRRTDCNTGHRDPGVVVERCSLPIP